MMGKKEKNGRDLRHHLVIGINANLISAIMVGVGHLVPKIPASMGWVGAVLIWLVLWICLQFIVKRKWSNVKHIGYYFLPTVGIFWVLKQQQSKVLAEAEIRRLQKIIDDQPSARLIERIGNPRTQKQSLDEIIDKMNSMGDVELAKIVGCIRYYARDILKSVGDNGNYKCFKQLIEKLSLYEANGNKETCRRFLWLLSDIFNMPPSGSFTRKVQKDMVGPLKHVIWRVNEGQLPAIKAIVEKIMADREDEHDMAREIVELLLSLDWRGKGVVCRMIFEEGKKRAFTFPNNFGFCFLNILKQLEHRVFGLNIQSLRDVVEQSLQNNETGLINLNRKMYEELCLKVFAPLEDPANKGICHCRVFRRLKGDLGKVVVECILDTGEICNCQGESLSFRGFYSENCQKKAAQRFKAKIKPLLDAKRELDLRVSVAKVHTDGHGNPVSGRGIFFEDAEEPVAKSLYEYVSNH